MHPIKCRNFCAAALQRLWIAIFALAVVTTGVVTAQPADTAPVFLWVRGDLWRYDPMLAAQPPTQITQVGTISSPVISPDAARIAYSAASPVSLEALSRIQIGVGAVAEFVLPQDIYLLDTATGESTLIAAQPADASLFVDGVPNRAIIRSAPVWSPDGAQLAWAETAFDSRLPRLVVYDLAQNGIALEVQDDTELPMVNGTLHTRWGTGGLMLWAEGEAGGVLAIFYALDGTRIARQFIPPPAAGDVVEDVVWVETTDDSLPGILFASGEWFLFDEVTGAAVQPAVLPQLTGRGYPDISYSVAFGVLDESGFFWEAFDPLAPDAASVAFPGSPARVTLAPSGRALALIGYPDFGNAAIFQNGELSAIPGTGINETDLYVGAVLWGATFWRISAS